VNQQKRFLLAGLVLVFAQACAGPMVRVDFDPAENYQAMKKWAWLSTSESDPENPPKRNDLIERRIRSAISQNLNGKGYTKAFTEDADFLVAYDTVIDQKTSVTSSPGYVGTTMGAYPGYGYGRTAYSPYGYGRYGGYGYGVAIPPQQTVRSYDEGTLIIDFLDHRDKKLFWRGSFSAKLSRHPTQQSTTETIQDAVKKILAKFPPD
jgi:hypothetical protein